MLPAQQLFVEKKDRMLVRERVCSANFISFFGLAVFFLTAEVLNVIIVLTLVWSLNTIYVNEDTTVMRTFS